MKKKEQMMTVVKDCLMFSCIGLLTFVIIKKGRKRTKDNVKENNDAISKTYSSFNKDLWHLSNEFIDNQSCCAISPADFGEYPDFETITLTYYVDGVLTDLSYNIIDNVVSVVGLDFKEHFGEYEPGVAYVRNNRLKTDYEILKKNKKFSDVLLEKPYLVSDADG